MKIFDSTRQTKAIHLSFGDIFLYIHASQWPPFSSGFVRFSLFPPHTNPIENTRYLLIAGFPQWTSFGTNRVCIHLTSAAYRARFGEHFTDLALPVTARKSSTARDKRNLFTYSLGTLFCAFIPPSGHHFHPVLSSFRCSHPTPTQSKTHDTS